MRSLVTLISIVMALVLAACSRGDKPPEPAPTVATGAQDTALAPDTAPDTDTGSSPEIAPTPKLDASAFSIEATPDQLMVYRSTPVILKIKTTSELPAGLACRWRMGDGSPEISGCEVEHVFLGGSADARIAVSLTLAGEEVSLTRIIPLERLEVLKRTEDPDSELPRAPEGTTSFRAVFLADTASLDSEALDALAGAVSALSPHLVIHLGGLADPTDSSSWTALRDRLVERLRGQNIPVLVAPSPSDLAAGAEVRRPMDGRGEPLELIDGDGFPGRYALSFRGVFFAILSGADQELDGATGLKWLRTRLAEAQVYESRVVLSHLPLHPFSAKGSAPGELLGPRFKLYELLHRGRVTALVSGGHAFFKGRYGALPVLAVGSAATGGTLLGVEREQPSSLAVIDFEDGVPARVFAVVSRDGKPFSALFDETLLPETVEVYTR